jgi:hypothetical protein
LSENFGSCITIEMRAPRIARILFRQRASGPSRRSASAFAVTRPGGRISRRIARPVIDLPDPDSPTIPSRSRPSVNDTPAHHLHPPVVGRGS